MSKVILDISMSLDGLIAQPDDDPGPIQEYLFSGETEHDGIFRTSGATTEVFREFVDAAGALITGRRTYDLTPTARVAGCRGGMSSGRHGVRRDFFVRGPAGRAWGAA